MADFSGVMKVVDNVGQLLARVHQLATQDVLIGVPSAKATRKEDPKVKEEPTNAQLAYIHEFGSPARRIPARPFLFPGIAKCKEQLVIMLKKGGKDVLMGRDNPARILNAVGMTARNSVVKEITDPAPPFVPLKPATIRARLRRTAAGRRKLKQIQKAGMSLSHWAVMIDPNSGSANIHPLIDTGQLRASITYIVRPTGSMTSGPTSLIYEAKTYDTGIIR